MESLIVSRHSAAVEWLRKQGVEAPVLSQATAADVRGKVVYGNLPLHLAAEAAQVVSIEFTGVPPRGLEYAVADMEAAGAVLRRYTVRAVVEEPPESFRFSDKRQPRGHYDILVLGKGDELVEFQGGDIPGLVATVDERHEKAGKWSGCEYTLRLAKGAWALLVSQDWDTGRRFASANTFGDVLATFRRAGCTASEEAVRSFFVAVFPKTAERIEAKEKALVSLE